MKNKSPLVSVLLVNFNGQKFLNNCLTSIFSNDYPNYEIIVIDNCSEDNSLSNLNQIFLKDQRLRIIRNFENTGPAGGLNLAAANASGQYLAILGYDTEVNPHWLTGYIDFMEKNPNVGIAQGKIMRLDKKQIFSYAGDYLGPFGFLAERARGARDLNQFNQIADIFSLNSASMIISKSLFQQLGGFDKDYFMYLEETDLCLRCHLFGKRVVFIPQSVVYHNFPLKNKSAKHFQTDIRRYYGCRNYILTLIKNLEPVNLLKILPLHLACWLILSFVFIITGRLQRGFLIIRAIFWHLLHLPTVLKKREWTQDNIRKVSDKSFKHLFSQMPLTYYLGKAKAYVKNEPF